MSHEGDRKPRRGAKYRDLAPALLLLTALALLMAGVTATRLGLITVDVKIGLGLRTDIPKMTTVTAPAPALARLARELIPTIVKAEAAVPRDTPGAPVKAAAFTPPRKLLAFAAGKPTRVADCAMVTSPANADPTEGEISGTTGLPDQVNYFRLGKKTPPCRPVARTVSSAR